MNSLVVQLLIGVAWVAVLTAAFYFGSRTLTRWVVVGRPTARWRRLLDESPDIVSAVGNGK